MKPFNDGYVLEKIDEYSKIIVPAKVGSYEIKAVDGLKGIIQGYLYAKEGEINKPILELHGPEHIWMRLTPLEIEGAHFSIKRAHGKVGVVGLGLGYTVWEMAKKESVSQVIVYEISQEVIDLYKMNNVSILDEATVATSPYNINVVKQLIIYVMVGLVLGCGISFVIFYFDRTIKSVEQVEQKIKLPILGSVQMYGKGGRK